MISKDHDRNREQFPEEELARYYGKYVAWNADGTRIVASGNEEAEVYRSLEELGHSLNEVVVSYVHSPDDVILGRLSLLGQEGDE